MVDLVKRSGRPAKAVVLLAFVAMVGGLFPSQVLQAQAATADNVMKVNVILASFAGSGQNLPWSKEEVQRQLFYASDSVSAYFQEVSYGKLQLIGQVFGPVAVASQQTCQPSGVFEQAIQAASGLPGFVNDNTKPTVIIAPFDPNACGWIGYSAGYSHFIAISSSAPNLRRVTAHELFHDLNLAHASSYYCGNNVSISDSGCSLDEYGDAFDVMGKSADGLPHFNAVHKEFAGWFNPGNEQVVRESNNFTLEPIETASNNLKVLKIPRKSSEYLYVEYRQPLGFDSSLGSDGAKIFGGALLHVAPENSARSYLINPVPQNQGNYVLRAGQSFTDPLTGTVVSVKGATMQGLTVDVSMGKGAPIISTASLSTERQFMSGSLVLDKGTIYFIQGSSKSPFTSMKVFNGLGYSLDNVSSGDTGSYALSGQVLNNAQAGHPVGSWINYKGTIYYVSEQGMIPVPSWEVFLNNSGQAKMIVKANAADIRLIRSSLISPLMAINDSRVVS